MIPPWIGALGLLLLAASGCAPRQRAALETPLSFTFGSDTFAFPNQTYWSYRENPETGVMEHETRVPRADYAHRCFVLVRAAKEFKLHAAFRPELPRASAESYRRKVRAVVRRSSRRAASEADRIEFPGYADLKAFSAEHRAILTEELGGSWQSYAQRGHWRILFPFSRRHQAGVAERLEEKLANGAIAAVHVIRFPDLTINHAVLAYAARSGTDSIRIMAYDPNNAEEPIELLFDRATGRFTMPRTPYFLGGEVDAYEVYCSAWY
ncbi:MAG: hypothetical protein AB7O66_14105 [Limisphaerales bacterium]